MASRKPSAKTPAKKVAPKKVATKKVASKKAAAAPSDAEPRKVVPAKYKQEYKQRGNARNCGDWLAQQLAGKFDTAEGGKFDEPAFTQCLVDNGVSLTGRWAELPESGQAGWVGRYRMNGRQQLEMRICESGYLLLPEGKVKVPREYLDHLHRLHPKLEVKWTGQTHPAPRKNGGGQK